MYEGTITFTWMNLKITLNSAFDGMNLLKMCGGSDVIGNDIYNVYGHNNFCFYEYIMTLNSTFYGIK